VHHALEGRIGRDRDTGPVLEQVAYLSLNVISIPLKIQRAYTKEGVPVTVEAVANVKIAGDDMSLRSAAERFLGMSVEQIKGVIFQTLEGHLRAILGTLTVLLVTFYLVADGPRFRRSVCSLFPQARQREVLAVWEVAIDKTSSYLVSRTTLALVCGTATTVFLFIIPVGFSNYPAALYLLGRADPGGLPAWSAWLAPLAAARVPILHIHGDSEKLITLEDHTAELARRYRALGGEDTTDFANALQLASLTFAQPRQDVTPPIHRMETFDYARTL
jgi:hypothetical protein